MSLRAHQGEMDRKGLSELACRSRSINPSPLRVLGCGSSKDGFHSLTSAFFFVHTLSCQIGGLQAFLLIYLLFWCPKDTMLTFVLIFFIIVPGKIE